MYLGKALKINHSLSFRLTFWYAAIFTFSSCVAFVFFYLLIMSVIRERTDQELRNQAGVFTALLSQHGIEAVKRAAVLEAQAAGERKIFFRLVYPNGQIFSSSNMSYWQNIGVQPDAIQMLLEGQPQVFRTLSIADHANKVRLLYSVIGPGIIMQIGHSMDHYSRIVDAFKTIFVITMSILLVASALIGWFLARRALSGFNVIARTARRISEGALKERVPVKNRHDEIDQLAETFNQMLDRIQLLVDGIKEMSDNIAHDLKSPLARIRGTAEITLTGDASLDDYRQLAAGTIEECDRLLDMINTMLLISKTRAGVTRLDQTRFDLVQVIGNACELFRPLAEEKNIALRCRLPAALMIEGDIRMIQRMIANLLDNAVKYIRPGKPGHIDIDLCLNDERTAVFSVKDTGIGISGNDLPHIFERFYRCDRSRSMTGTGLGLSLALAVARAHGGGITVISQPEAGSTFTVTLPLFPSTSMNL